MTTPPTEGRYADDAGRYRLDARLATGGMGTVWRGTDTTLARPVAVKLLKDEYADNPSFRARFETEAQHAAALAHPNIAAVYDFGEAARDDGSGVPRPYLVMELVDGQPLSALLRPGEPLDPDAVRLLLSQAAAGLGAAHAAGIVHRDVKPANLLVTPDREVKVTDFGIARAAEGIGLTRTGEVMGTPQYLSPEQAQGQAATPASDVYSLGVVAFECLAGRRPFVADTAVATALAHLRDPVPDLPDSVPADLAAVVRRAMAKLPQDRFRDGHALAEALRDPATAVIAGGALTGAAAAAAAAGAASADPDDADEPTRLIGTGAVPAPVPAVRPGPPPAAPGAGRSTPRRSALLPVLVVLAVAAVALVAAYVLLGRDGGAPAPERPDRGGPGPTSGSSAPAGPSRSSPSAQPSATASSAPTRTPSSDPASSAPASSAAPTSAAPTPTPTPTTPATSAPPSVAPTTSAPPVPEASASPVASQPPASPSASGRPSPSTSQPPQPARPSVSTGSSGSTGSTGSTGSSASGAASSVSARAGRSSTASPQTSSPQTSSPETSSPGSTSEVPAR